FIGITFIVMFTLSSIIPFALAQNAGQGYQSSSIEELLHLARERVLMTSDHPFVSGMPETDPFFHHFLWGKDIAYFVYSIFGIIIVSGSIFFILFVRMRRISFNKTKNDIH